MTTRDLENGFFEPEDFLMDAVCERVADISLYPDSLKALINEHAARQANSILSQWLKEQVTVYGTHDGTLWSKLLNGSGPSATLVNIKKVE